MKLAIKNQAKINETIIETDYYENIYTNEDIDNNLNHNISTEELVNTMITSKLGLKNLGNTCYINTSIQILIHLKKLLINLKNLSSNNKDNISANFIELVFDI